MDIRKILFVTGAFLFFTALSTAVFVHFYVNHFEPTLDFSKKELQNFKFTSQVNFRTAIVTESKDSLDNNLALNISYNMQFDSVVVVSPGKYSVAASIHDVTILSETADSSGTETLVISGDTVRFTQGDLLVIDSKLGVNAALAQDLLHAYKSENLRGRIEINQFGTVVSRSGSNEFIQFVSDWLDTQPGLLGFVLPEKGINKNEDWKSVTELSSLANTEFSKGEGKGLFTFTFDRDKRSDGFILSIESVLEVNAPQAEIAFGKTKVPVQNIRGIQKNIGTSYFDESMVFESYQVGGTGNLSMRGTYRNEEVEIFVQTKTMTTIGR